MSGIQPDCDRLVEKLALLHLRLFPRPFSSHATGWSGIVAEGTSVCRFKSVPTSVIADRLAHGRQTRVSRVGKIRCEAVNSDVKIASDVLTEHCCQVCVLLAMIFCRSDCRLCSGMCGKWLRNQAVAIRKLLVLAYHVFWPVDTPTGQHGIWKIFLTFDFYIRQQKLSNSSSHSQ